MSKNKLDLTEEVNLILEGSEVSDEFKNKLETILEATISSKVKTISEDLEAEATIKLAEAKESLIESLQEANAEYEETLEENVSKYLDHVITEWMEENELAIDSGIKVERAENFMEGIEQLFSENFVEVPESGENVIAISEDKIMKMEESIDSQLSTIAELKESNESLIKDRIISSQSTGLTDTEQEKLVSLSEDVAFVNESAFANKVAMIKESYFKVEDPSKEVLNEEVGNPLIDAIAPIKQVASVSKYLSAFR